MFPASCSRNPTDPCLLGYQVCAARLQVEAFEVVKSGKGPGGATARDWESSAACWSLGVKGKGEKGSL